MAPKNDDKVGVSQRDMEIILAALQSLKSAPEIDFEALKEKAAFKNANTARTQWNTLKKKYGMVLPATPGGNPKETTFVAPRKRKQPFPGDDDLSIGSPLKKVKNEEENDEGDDGEEVKIEDFSEDVV